MEKVRKSLKDDGLIGSKTEDQVWILCDARNPVAVERLLKRANAPKEQQPMVWVLSLEQFKLFVPLLHPRVETLLHYHRRPLRVLCRDWRHLPAQLADEEGRIGFQLSDEEWLSELIEQYQRPLAGIKIPVNLIAHFGNPDLWLDDVPPGKKMESLEKEVQIEYTVEGELIFL